VSGMADFFGIHGANGDTMLFSFTADQLTPRNHSWFLPPQKSQNHAKKKKKKKILLDLLHSLSTKTHFRIVMQQRKNEIPQRRIHVRRKLQALVDASEKFFVISTMIVKRNISNENFVTEKNTKN
jgi:hypothetical protein